MAENDQEEPEQAIINIGTYDGPRNELGEREGRGRSIYANKDVYVGEFAHGLREGNGTYRWAYLGLKYRGQYKAGLRHGKGTMWYTNGTIYEGLWECGRRHGQGRMEYPNLDVYEGQWESGLPHGAGKYYYFACDSVAQGTFSFGRITKGELLLRDGSKWTGEFRLNQPFGKGQWTMDGWEQAGEFVEINPPVKEEEAVEEEKKEEAAEDEDAEKSVQEEVEEDEKAKNAALEAKEKEDAEADAGEPKEGEEEDQKQKVDPREKTLRALLPPKKTRKIIQYDIKEKMEKMRTLKLRWIPAGLPERKK